MSLSKTLYLYPLLSTELNKNVHRGVKHQLKQTYLSSILQMKQIKHRLISNSYTMGCPPVRGDNPRALASGLSYVQVDKHGITILYHLHQCRRCTSRDI